MDPNDIQDRFLYRYETESGFTVETPNRVVSVFNAQIGAITWMNLVPDSTDDRYQAFLQRVAEAAKQRVEDVMSPSYQISAGIWYENQTILDPSVLPPALDMPDLNDWGSEQVCEHQSIRSHSPTNIGHGLALFEEAIWSEVGATLGDQIQVFRDCVEERDSRIVDHNPRHSVLMAGKEFLVSKSQQEKIEASARSHVTHFESLTLSREHTNPDLSSNLLDKLKIGWRKCVAFLKFLNIANNLGRFIGWSGKFCPILTIRVSPTI